MYEYNSALYYQNSTTYYKISGLTKDDIGLGNVTNDAQLKRSADDWSGFTLDPAPAGTMWLLGEQAAGGAKRRFQISTLPGGGGGGETVKVSANDTTAGYLEDKLDETANRLTIDVQNEGANESLLFDVGSDILDKTTAGQLNALTAKIDVHDNDPLLLEDSQSAYAKRKVLTKNLPFPKWYIEALQVTWQSIIQVQISAGECRDSTDAFNIVSTSALNAAITTSGVNGLDTGSEAADTWYFIYVVKGSSGLGTLLSASATAPVLPAGYDDSFRRVGSVYNDGSSNFREFHQYGKSRMRRVTYEEDRLTTLKALTGGAATSWTAVDVSEWVPTTADWMEIFAVSSDVFDNYSSIRPSGWTGSGNGLFAVLASTASGVVAQVPNDGEELQYANNAALGSLDIEMVGYTEEV
jgi:hypothetical protein